MTFLNTHWTWQYGLMLVFVFWTALRLYAKVWPITLIQVFEDKLWWDYKARQWFWAALATFFFHQWW